MGKGREWDYAFRIKGVTPRSIPMARMAEYMKEFAGLLGDEGRPVFAGMVGGSVVLRARETLSIPAKIITGRLRAARVDRSAPGGSNYARLNDMLANDGAEGIVIDREQHEIIELPGRSEVAVFLAEPPPQIVSDVGTLDGVVVSIGGRDDTMHLQLQDFDGKVRLITVRSVELARRLAPHFRGDAIRVHVMAPGGECLPAAGSRNRSTRIASRSSTSVQPSRSSRSWPRSRAMDGPRSTTRTRNGALFGVTIDSRHRCKRAHRVVRDEAGRRCRSSGSAVRYGFQSGWSDHRPNSLNHLAAAIIAFRKVPLQVNIIYG